MPFLERLIRKPVALLVAGLGIEGNPVGFRVQQDVHVLGRLGQLAVDRAGEGMDEVGPAGIPDPERAAALAAEAALGRALLAVDLGVELGDELLAARLQALCLGAEIDGIAAATGSLAAD